MSRREVLTPSTRVLTPPARRRAVRVVFSSRRAESDRLLYAMRHHQVMPDRSRSWGSEQAYLDLLGAGSPLVVLDVPDETDDAGPEWNVRVLSSFSAVIVLTTGRTDPVRLLLAGAVNVLPRDLPPRELAGRLSAERRWLELSGPGSGRRFPRDVRRAPGVRHRSQRVLFHLLSSASRPLCCHDLCLLLGGPGAPLRRRALQARMNRLDERLAEHGMAVRSTVEWGRTTYRGIHEDRR